MNHDDILETLTPRVDHDDILDSPIRGANDYDSHLASKGLRFANQPRATTICMKNGADKEDIFLFLLSATSYT